MRSFKKYFVFFCNQAGTPEVFATGDYDVDSKTYKLTLRQSSKKEGTLPFHIPVVVGLLLKEDGSEVRRLCLTLPSITKIQTLAFFAIPSGPLRHFN